MGDGAAEGAVEGCEDAVEAEERESVGEEDEEAAGECFAAVLLLQPGLEHVAGCRE